MKNTDMMPTQIDLRPQFKVCFIASFVLAMLVPPSFSVEKLLGLPAWLFPLSEACASTKLCLPSLSTYFFAMFLLVPALVFWVYRKNPSVHAFSWGKLLKMTLACIFCQLLVWYFLYGKISVNATDSIVTSGEAFLIFMVSSRIGLSVCGGVVIAATVFFVYATFIALPRAWIHRLRNG